MNLVLSNLQCKLMVTASLAKTAQSMQTCSIRIQPSLMERKTLLVRPLNCFMRTAKYVCIGDILVMRQAFFSPFSENQLRIQFYPTSWGYLHMCSKYIIEIQYRMLLYFNNIIFHIQASRNDQLLSGKIILFKFMLRDGCLAGLIDMRNSNLQSSCDSDDINFKIFDMDKYAWLSILTLILKVKPE